MGASTAVTPKRAACLATSRRVKAAIRSDSPMTASASKKFRTINANAAGAPQLGEDLVNVGAAAGPSARERYDKVPHLAVALQARGIREWVSRPRGDHEVFLVKDALGEAGRNRVKRHQRDVYHARVERGVAVQVPHADVDAGRDAADLGEGLGQEHGGERVGGANREPARRSGGVERSCRRNHAPRPRQDVGDRLGQLRRAGGRDHALGRAEEQGVVQEPCAADRGRG